MRIFVTGASGYIGLAVVRALKRAGHSVTGLVRSEAKADLVTAAGAEPFIGELQEPGRWSLTAREHDGFAHLGFAAGPEAVEIDRVATEALLQAAGDDGQRALIYTSGVWVLGETDGEPAEETTPADHPAEAVAWRTGRERQVLESGSDLLAAAVIRPGIVYGGYRGLVAPMFASADREGAAAFAGEGRNRWAMVHRDDLAELYRLVLEKRLTGIFHGVDGTALRVDEIAVAASEAAHRHGNIRSVPYAEARRSLGLIADALCMDQVVRTTRAEEAGWVLKHRSFLESAPAAYAEWQRGED